MSNDGTRMQINLAKSTISNLLMNNWSREYSTKSIRSNYAARNLGSVFFFCCSYIVLSSFPSIFGGLPSRWLRQITAAHDQRINTPKSRINEHDAKWRNRQRRPSAGHRPLDGRPLAGPSTTKTHTWRNLRHLQRIQWPLAAESHHFPVVISPFFLWFTEG